jgi:DNA-binding NarL/FixJ family response regulator
MPNGERGMGETEDSAEYIRSRLSERELEVFTQLSTGHSNKTIARTMGLSENTVNKHVASILAKLGLENRTQAAVRAVRTGFPCVAAVVALVPDLAEEAEHFLGAALSIAF